MKKKITIKTLRGWAVWFPKTYGVKSLTLFNTKKQAKNSRMFEGSKLKMITVILYDTEETFASKS